MYNNETYEIGQTINGRIFTIKEPTNPNSPYTFMVEASDDVTEEEWLGCCNYLTQNHKATIYQHYECSSTQYTGEVDFSEISYLNGDANRDKITTIADAAAIMQAIGNPDKYALSDLGEFNADSKGDGLTVDDAVAIQKKLAGIE